MNVIINFLLALTLLIFGTSVAQNNSQIVEPNSFVETSEFNAVEILATEFLKQTNLPGISIAVSKNQEVIYAKGFGYADKENSVAMTPSTRLRTASVAKVITATALGRLISEGTLDVDVPISQYIPYINAQYANLTTRQLAGHTSGMEHRPSGNRGKNKQHTEIKETVELMDEPLLFTPDTDYKYSTHAYNLLAAVIEGASGKSYEDYMNTEVFEPLGMTNTIPENIDALTNNDAKLYYLKNDKLRKEKLSNGSYKLPGAGFRSTPTDLVKMMNAYSNGLISESAVATMFKSHQLTNGEKTNVGIAWRSSYDVFGNQPIEHAGHWRGARTVVVYYPEEELSIALMINSGGQIFIEETAHLFAALFRKNADSQPEISVTNQRIEITSQGNGEALKYNGTISLNGEQGTLKADTDGFLKSVPIYYLGSGNHYAVVTKYGLMYLELSNEPTVNGKIYMYSNRLKTNPILEKEKASFKAINK